MAFKNFISRQKSSKIVRCDFELKETDPKAMGGISDFSNLSGTHSELLPKYGDPGATESPLKTSSPVENHQKLSKMFLN